MKIWKNTKLNLTNDEINKLINAKNEKDELIYLFKFIKDRNWISYTESRNIRSDGVIGNIFEDLVGVKENNNKSSDYGNFELKTKKDNSSSFVSLFGYSIDSIKFASTEIREKFGVIDNESSKKIFNSTIKYENWNTHRGGYKFKLDKNNDKLYLEIKRAIDEYPIDKYKYYWNINKIEKLFNKIKNICYVEADHDSLSKKVKFNQMTIYENANIDAFWKLLKDGDIVVDFRIGVYKSGKKKGKTHDHGTGFRIKKNKINDLFLSKEIY